MSQPTPPPNVSPAVRVASDNAACCSEAERLRLAIELAPEQPWLGARGSAVRIDRNALHRGEIDDKAIVEDGTPGDIVPAAADRKRQSLPCVRSSTPGDDVSRPDAVHGEGRTAVDRGRYERYV